MWPVCSPAPRERLSGALGRLQTGKFTRGRVPAPRGEALRGDRERSIAAREAEGEESTVSLRLSKLHGATEELPTTERNKQGTRQDKTDKGRRRTKGKREKEKEKKKDRRRKERKDQDSRMKNEEGNRTYQGITCQVNKFKASHHIQAQATSHSKFRDV